MIRNAGSFLMVCLAIACQVRTGNPALVTLRNHNYVSGGAFTAVSGFDEFEVAATSFVAEPAAYPFKVNKVRVLAAGGGLAPWTVDFWHDAIDATPTPEAQFHFGDTGYIIQAGWNEIDLSAANIVVNSGGVRIGLTYVGIGGSPVAIGADMDGMLMRRNFVRRTPATWRFAENEFIQGDFILELVIDTPGVAGDFNADGNVDAADYVVWRNDPSTFPANAYSIWRANFGNPPGGSGAAQLISVPEPAGCVLLALLFLATVRRRSPTRC